MKLGELKTQLRTMKGNPVVTSFLPNGLELRVTVQKSSLMEEFERLFGKQKSVETGLQFADIDGEMQLTGCFAPSIDGTRIVDTSPSNDDDDEYIL